MKKGLIILFLSFSIVLTFSQQGEKKVSRDLNPYVYLDSAAVFEKINPSRSFDFIEKALTESLKTGDKKLEALSYRSLGRVNENLNQMDLAVQYYRRAIDLLENLHWNQQLVSTYILLGDAFYKTQKYPDALSSYRKGLSYTGENRTENEWIEIQKKMAEVYSVTGENKKALDILDEVLKTEQKRKNTQGIIEAQNRMGTIYQETDEKEKAIEVYEKSAEMAEEIDDRDALKKSLKNKSSVLRQSKRYDEELEVRQQLLDLSSEEKRIPDEADENLEIGNIYIEKNEAGKAIPFIQKSIELSEEAGNLEKKGKALQTLSNAYGKQQNYDKALLVYQEYVKTMDDVYKKREYEILSGMQIAATLNRKLERLDLIEKDLQLSQKTVDLLRQEQLIHMRELKAQRIFTWSLLGILGILGAASIFILHSANLKRKANQMLALRSLRSQMNPHFIYNSLNSVNNFISGRDEKAANKYLSDFSRLMRSVMENSKHDFVPLSSEVEIIRLYLILEHSRFSDKFDYSFETGNLENENFLIPPMLIQPFVENSIWHGLRYREEKGFLKVSMVKTTNSIKIIIEDNGIGRKKSTELKTRFQKEHLSTGLMNIENRIHIINKLFATRIEIGVEDLNRETGEGTRVVITIPGKKIFFEN